MSQMDEGVYGGGWGLGDFANLGRGLWQDYLGAKVAVATSPSVTPTVGGVGVNSSSTYEDFMAQNSLLVKLVAGAVVTAAALAIYATVKKK